MSEGDGCDIEKVVVNSSYRELLKNSRDLDGEGSEKEAVDALKRWS